MSSRRLTSAWKGRFSSLIPGLPGIFLIWLVGQVLSRPRPVKVPARDNRAASRRFRGRGEGPIYGAMSRNRLLALLIGTALALAIGIGISGLFLPHGPLVGGVKMTGTPLIGGPFHLVDTDGRPRSDADFRGKLMLIYFG